MSVVRLHSRIEGLVQVLCAEAFAVRADRLAGYLGQRDPARNEEALRALIRRTAQETGAGDSPIQAPFTTFKRRIEAVFFGIVFTAHPTFSTSEALVRSLAELGTGVAADGAPLTPETIDARLRGALGTEHRPEPAIDLPLEQPRSLLDIMSENGEM